MPKEQCQSDCANITFRIEKEIWHEQELNDGMGVVVLLLAYL